MNIVKSKNPKLQKITSKKIIMSEGKLVISKKLINKVKIKMQL